MSSKTSETNKESKSHQSEDTTQNKEKDKKTDKQPNSTKEPPKSQAVEKVDKTPGTKAGGPPGAEVKIGRELDRMKDFKLIYFNGRGRGEIIRLIFVTAGIPFEDFRVEAQQWPEIKAKAPFGQLPILEFQGEVYFQSLAIAKFLARKFGLAGKTEMDVFKVDIVVDTIEDIIKPIAPFWRYEPDENRKAELKKVYLEETLPNNLNNFERILKSNKNGDGYFVGENLTWADLHLLNLLAMLEVMVLIKNPFDNHPKLKALAHRISTEPKVAEWLSKRPESAF